MSIRVLKSPGAILAGTVAGIALGLKAKEASLQLAIFGDIYLSFLKMCVIPIMITAVVASFGRLLSNAESKEYLKKIIIVFALNMLLVGMVGTVTAIVGNPGSGISHEARETLGQELLKAEQSGNSSQSVPAAGLGNILRDLIPSNIFTALYEGKNLQLLFVSIVFGLTLGIIPHKNSEQILVLNQSIFSVFERIIGLAMYMLPLGLMGIMAGEIARSGVGMLLAMTRFVGLVHLAALISIIVAGALTVLLTKRRPWQLLKHLREPALVAFGTRNSYATMPSIFKSLRTNFQVPENAVNLTVPLSIVICRYSMILLFTLGSVFLLQLYGQPVDLSNIVYIYFSTIVAALAGAGAPGVVALAMISMVIGPLGLPVDAAVILLLAANTVLDPILTVLNVTLTSFSAVVIGGAAASPTLDNHHYAAEDPYLHSVKEVF